ncbi:hypothetical protein EV380_2560 [Zhihengliuella halotolerans]|uniref:Uncharacterized protein n=1 Tax=Zhihengliuella halotolerans TaxID=370736 RepID=A0A4Q8AFF6_9MICC|nr:hypothetical protein EV380_2560 [Zhihengliuella halotolerans]
MNERRKVWTVIAIGLAVFAVSVAIMMSGVLAYWLDSG